MLGDRHQQWHGPGGRLQVLFIERVGVWKELKGLVEVRIDVICD